MAPTLLRGQQAFQSNGWEMLTATLTYSSASVINSSVDLTGLLQKGDKLKLTQHSATKYFYVLAVSSTQITVTAGSDFVVEDTATYAITAPFFSKVLSPQGFPQYFAYTPTGPTNSTLSGRFSLIGNMCDCWIKILSTGAISFTNMPTLPITASASVSHRDFIGGYVDAGTAARWGKIIGHIEGSYTRLSLFNGETTTGDVPLLSSTVPITWANNDLIEIGFQYEI